MENTLKPAEEKAGLATRRALFTTLAPYLALLTGMLALSMSGLFTRWSTAPGSVTSFYRMAIAAIFMLPIYLRHQARARRDPSVRLPRAALLIFPILGGIFAGLDHFVWSTSIGLTKVANSTLLNNMAPLWVALFALIFWKERLKPRFWAGLALALAGATAIFGTDLVMNPHMGYGDLLGLLSSVFYAAYYLVTQRSRRDFATLPYVWMVAATAAVFLLVINLSLHRPLSGYELPTYMAFLGAGLFSQVIGYFSVSYALGKLPAAVVAPTMLAQPVITAVLAVPLAGEPISTMQWVGGLITLLGIYLVNRRS
jgi:drug/metabolite transporter (DMT)-like permease